MNMNNGKDKREFTALRSKDLYAQKLGLELWSAGDGTVHTQLMNSKGSDSGALHKKEVLLSICDPEYGEQFVEAAVESFTTTLLCSADKNRPWRLLYKTPEAIIQAMNDSSDEFLFRLKPCDRSDFFEDFRRCVLPRVLDFMSDIWNERIHALNIQSAALKNESLGHLEQVSIDLSSWLANVSQLDEVVINIGFVDETEKKIRWCSIPDTTILKRLLKAYAAERGLPLSSMWFKHGKETLHLSKLRKVSVSGHGLVDKDHISVHRRQRSRTPLKALTNNNVQTRLKKTAKRQTKKEGKKPVPPRLKSREAYEEETRKKDLRYWMDALSLCFGEAEPLFKKRREEIHALGLMRDGPKQRTQATAKTSSTSSSEVATNCFGGKPGKSCFRIRVGDEANLFKTSKAASKMNRRTSKNDLVSVDLHGLTAEEALRVLNHHLPQWIDTAMNGPAPWIVTVEIVCGGGGQILAEAVVKWIRRTRQVCHAPKSIHP